MSKISGISILPLKGNIIFPNTTTKLEIARAKSKSTILVASRVDKQIFLVAQTDHGNDNPLNMGDLHRVGVVANIDKVKVKADDTLSAIMTIVGPAVLTSCDFTSVQMRGEVDTFSYEVGDTGQSGALKAKTLEAILELSKLTKGISGEKIETFAGSGGTDPIVFVNRLANDLVTTTTERQDILGTIDNEVRLEMLAAYVLGGLELAKAEKRISNRVKKQIEDGQKEYYLREQMKAISKELGEDENEIAEYHKRIEDALMPQDVAKKARKEVSRLTRMAPTSPESSVIRNYVDWLCDLPWANSTTDNKDLVRARAILDEDHYGLDKIKERIVEFLAVMQLTGKLNGPILCFVGPPGVGKTSIVKSIARALDRNYLRVSLGGVRDESEIRGHRRTYVGAIPGKIMYMMKQAGCINPVMLLDEIDKMGKDQRGDPASAMLEVLDPEQNNSFSDHFLEVQYDLSKVLFVCTANSAEDIPEPLLDRMEIIELSGYTELDKVHIAEKFLLSKNMKLHGIPEDAFTIDGDTCRAIIEQYTRESGVRSLERQIATICRKVALKIVNNPNEQITVSVDNLEQYLGTAKIKPEKFDHKDTVGTATGLAWTRVGGTTLSIDCTLFAGKGNVMLTGKLGDVMKESAHTGISLVKSLASKYGIDSDKFDKTDIHIHIPEGAIPKDGPSAGITMTTVVMSAFSGRAIRGDVAMTGEVTLRGKVLPIGGVKEKVLAAYRAGIRTVILPSDNANDISEIPSEIASQISFVIAESIEDVLDCALVK